VNEVNFDLQAKGWDTDRRTQRAKIIAEKIRSLIGGENKSAMEYGCGTGLVGMQLTDAFAHVLFMDSSPGMVDEVNRKIGNTPNASAVVCDLAESMPMDYRFDCIFSSMALHHIKDTETILARFYSLLNKDGCLIIVDLDQDDGSFHANEAGFDGHDGFDQTELNNMLIKAGFHGVELQTFYHNRKEMAKGLVPYSLFVAKADK
jgi:ubiquinone/menaquinone biosynthesis C-methylase UbiE